MLLIDFLDIAVLLASLVNELDWIYSIGIQISLIPLDIQKIQNYMTRSLFLSFLYHCTFTIFVFNILWCEFCGGISFED